MSKKKHFYDNIMEQVGAQLHKVNFEGVLGAVGLQLAKHGRGASLPIVAAFGAGMAVGAGTALLLTPLTGRDLRGKLGELLQKLPHWGAKHDNDLEASPELPHDGASESETAAANSAHGGKQGKRGNLDGATA